MSDLDRQASGTPYYEPDYHACPKCGNEMEWAAPKPTAALLLVGFLVVAEGGEPGLSIQGAVIAVQQESA